MKGKLKAVFAIMLLALLLIGMASCSGKGNSVAGTWETEHLTLVFNADGTGIQKAAGMDDAAIIYTVTEKSSENGNAFDVAWGTGNDGVITRTFGIATWDGKNELDGGQGIILKRK